MVQSTSLDVPAATLQSRVPSYPDVPWVLGNPQGPGCNAAIPCPFPSRCPRSTWESLGIPGIPKYQRDIGMGTDMDYRTQDWGLSRRDCWIHTITHNGMVIAVVHTIIIDIAKGLHSIIILLCVLGMSEEGCWHTWTTTRR